MSGLLMESLGWALLHSLWQGTLVAAALAVALMTVGRRAANARYALACGALLLAVVLPAVTGWRQASEARMERRLSRGAGSEWTGGAKSSGEATAPSLATRRGARQDGGSRAAPMETMGRRAGHEGARGATLEQRGTELTGWGVARARTALAENLRWLVFLWVAGVGLSSGRLTAEWVRLRQLTRRAVAAPAEWQARLDMLSERLGLTRAVRLLQSTEVDVPSAVGFLSPVVLLPVSALSGLPARQLEMVLAHELAHIRRHDFAVNLVQVLVETLFFYHPAIRWVSGVIREERENCCDDVAVSASGNSVSYARALTALESLRVLPEAPSPAMSALGGSLPDRVRRIITTPATHCSSRWAAGASVLTLVSSLAVAAPLTSLVLRQSTAVAPNAPASPAALAPPSTTIAAPGAPPALAVGPKVDLDVAVAPKVAFALTVAPKRPALVSATTKAAFAVPLPQVAAAATPVTKAAFAVPLPQVVAAAAPVAAPKPVTPDEDDADDADDPDERTSVGAGQALSVDQLVALKVAGVTPERVKEMESMGYEPTVGNLVKMSHAGVTPAFTKEMNERFGEKLDAGTLVKLRHMGVTPDYLAALQSAGFETNDPEEIIQARALGVDAAYVQGLKAAGYSGMSLEELSELRAVGVNPDYIAALARHGVSKLDVDDLTQLRATGVTPEWLGQMRSAGVKTTDPEELTELRALGIQPRFLRELNDAGLKDLSVDELVRLRSGGVDADFIRRLRDSK
ncbi:M56 family metallopeptidase [Corallococcus silvisoli]|uniref:M56 family metallopeptidase n=1 Tax=Corallococcus silvisoli TaxID=2697031 RepID=UPI001376BA61|nr:M56 family metallopeptidase [Corallococcus silvisoli]NBD08950.1 peptidase M56 [Corallococcus silvisoli]